MESGLDAFRGDWRDFQRKTSQVTSHDRLQVQPPFILDVGYLRMPNQGDGTRI